MSWDNKKDDWNLSVRTGPSIGKASENRMLDAMGGNDTIKKRLQTNADGSVTMAHTRGPGTRPEFVTTNGSINSAFQCSLEMDSGIADMIGAGDYNPNAILPAKVYRTEYVSTHVGTSAKAIGAGKLKLPNLEGPVVADGADAKAFPGGTSFKDRKALALHIPASLFTGRTRLYVQSLFGGNWPALVLADASNGAGRPILSVNTAARVSAGLQPALIGSGCGIYFDAVNKNHFLIQTSPTQAVVIPLLGTACAEKYRTLLRSDTSLSVADQERIEAYILSQSFPNPDFATFLDHESTPSEALGYSWHFNWSGDKCDIIDVQEVWIPSASCYGFTTTHYRLTFANVGMNLSVTRSVVTGPDTWSVPKNINVIAYPDWFQKVLWKAGNLPSGRTDISQTGTLYCFYAKDELKLITVKTAPKSFDAERVSHPPTYGGARVSAPHYGLTEQQSGVSVYTDTWSGYFVTFAVDGVTIGGASGTSQKVRTISTWDGRSAPVYHYQGESPYAIGEIYKYDVGEPTVTVTWDGTGYWSSPVSTWAQEVLDPPDPSRGYIGGVANYTTYGYWNRTGEGYTAVTSRKTLVIIPFGDAEAVYLIGETHESRTGSRWSDRHRCWAYGEADHWINQTVGTPPNEVGASVSAHSTHYVFSSENNNWEVVSNGPTSDFTEAVTTTDTQMLVCTNGTLPVPTLPSYGTFYSTEKYVTQMYTTLSSANGAVFAEDTGVKSGANIYPHLSAYLGWA